MIKVVTDALRPLKPMAIVCPKAITKVVKIVFINGKVGCCFDCIQQRLCDIVIVTCPVATTSEVSAVISNSWTQTALRDSDGVDLKKGVGWGVEVTAYKKDCLLPISRYFTNINRGRESVDLNIYCM